MGSSFPRAPQRRHTGLHDSADDDDLEYECRKFRICIIGRAGVGKSTLLGKVFGMTDEQVIGDTDFYDGLMLIAMNNRRMLETENRPFIMVVEFIIYGM